MITMITVIHLHCFTISENWINMRSLGYCVAFAVFCFLLSCSPLGIERPGQISYNESSPLTKAEQEQLSGINSFAFELARVIQKDSGNNSFVFSPLNMACELGICLKALVAKHEAKYARL